MMAASERYTSFTMPVTCGRTSATRNGVVRPGSSRVSVTAWDLSVTTPTSAGGMPAPGGAPAF